MAELHVAEHLVRKLNDIARREHRSVDEVLAEALTTYTNASLDVEAVEIGEADVQSDLFLLIAQAADQLGHASIEGDIAERSRELLNNDYPEYLMQRLKDQDTDEQNSR